jgi:hypothetical protein
MTTDSDITAWLSGRLPEEWTSLDPAQITIDREEITIVLSLAAPELGDDAGQADRVAALDGRITGFREDTRERRIRIASDAEHRFEKKVSWGVVVGGEGRMFTHLAAPAMTRLRQPERQVLDTLVAANVARSRADALAWCVRLVGQNLDEWLDDLREALQKVEEVRHAGPK